MKDNSFKVKEIVKAWIDSKKKIYEYESPRVVQLTFLLYDNGTAIAMANGSKSLQEWETEFANMYSLLRADKGKAMALSYCPDKPFKIKNMMNKDA